uniref:NADH-ubiquinone oxidoreductase chain 2 n=1 Tax=Tectus pyramis TaxID=500102 RepID=A0A291C519_9VEST|nr:NADH dehydrogenase subunit 2 [Tectus pyramis]ATF29387.1 NADH dehydrogenase subunit 2 [Tectus pyramis]
MFIFVLLFGTILSLSSLHWLMIWVGLEINLMGFIPILVYRGITQESESGMKYFIVQAVGSGMVMAGSLYSFKSALSWEILQDGGYLLGLSVLVAGLMMKLGSFPFHFWLPSVMAGMSWFGCLILTTWQKVAPMLLISALMHMWFIGSVWGKIMIIFASLGSLVGGVGGLNQTQLRALLAYSSIGHIGWMLFSSLINESVLKVYFLIYFIISVCVFMVLWWFEKSNYLQLSSLSVGSSKIFQVCLIFMLLSLGGMPPFLGFVGKWLAIWSCCELQVPFSVSFLLMGSLISLFYYLSLLFTVSFISAGNLICSNNLHGSFNLGLLSGSSNSDLVNSNILGSFSINSESGTITGSKKSIFRIGMMGVWLLNVIFLLNLIGGVFIFLSIPFSEFL